MTDHAELETAYIESWHTYSVTRYSRYMSDLGKRLVKSTYRQSLRALLVAGYTRQQARALQVREVGEEMGR